MLQIPTGVNTFLLVKITSAWDPLTQHMYSKRTGLSGKDFYLDRLVLEDVFMPT